MTASQLFSLANPLALAGWILLIFFPRTRWSKAIVRAIPLVLAALYLVLLALHWGESRGSFNSLDGVAALFTNPWILLAGWIHYLAFDLFIGIWEVRDAAERGIRHWLVTPCLVLTFLFGPAGLLLYYALRTATGAAPARRSPA